MTFLQYCTPRLLQCYFILFLKQFDETVLATNAAHRELLFTLGEFKLQFISEKRHVFKSKSSPESCSIVPKPQLVNKVDRLSQ